MAGRLTIQRTPRALLDWLGMKGSGDSPNEVQPAVQTVVEIGRTYLQDRLSSQSGLTSSITTNGYFTQATGGLTVPAGEMWIVSMFACNIFTALPAGTGWTMSIGCFRNINNRTYSISPGVVVPAAGTGVLGELYDGSLILNSGDSMGIWVTNGAFGSAVPVTVNLEYYRLLI